MAARTAPLALPEPTRWAAEAFTLEHLGHLIDRRSIDLPRSSSAWRGGQRAADAAVGRFDVTGYAVGRRRTYPQRRRHTSGLSPYVRHGLLTLPALWDAVEGPADDVAAFRLGLARQEHARHRYAHVAATGRPRHRSTPVQHNADGDATRSDVHKGRSDGTRNGGSPDGDATRSDDGRGWNRAMGCMALPLDELEEDGWLVDEARRWLASHWITDRRRPTAGAEEHLFRHLLDGSRAASWAGWAEARATPVTRWDVEEWAPGLCASCELVARCPIERPRPDPAATTPPTRSARAAHRAPNQVGGPDRPHLAGDGTQPDAVWLTAESLGDADPALAAHPHLPAVFVFDEPLLDRLRLSAKRLTFLVETLADLATRRTVEVYLGDPVATLTGRSLATTFAPVPGWRSRAERLDLAAVHPWPWLRYPLDDDLATFDTWRAEHL